MGIDLGTTFTAAAVCRDGRAEMVSLGNRNLTIPSVVYLQTDNSYLVGDQAARKPPVTPQRVAREFKRRIGDPVPLMLGGSALSADALTGELLRQVVKTAIGYEDSDPDHAVITHPANWGPYKTDLLWQAIQMSGLGQRCGVSLMTEPEAAAAKYASDVSVPAGAAVAVYDLGGGTFDAAVLCATPTGWRILGPAEGIERLGGIDFDHAVFKYVDDALDGRLSSLDDTDPMVLAGLAALRRECVDAKEALSTETAVSIPVALAGTFTEIRLTRAEFESMIRPNVTISVQTLVRTIRAAGVPLSDLYSVVLVGGSSRIPLITESVGAALGVPVVGDAHPKNTIALGAALTAARRAAVPRAAAGGVSRRSWMSPPPVRPTEPVRPPIPPPPLIIVPAFPPTSPTEPVRPPTPPPAVSPLPPAARPLPPTASPLPPAVSPLPPTASPLPPTASPLPPTASPLPPTASPLPPAASPLPEPTIAAAAAASPRRKLVWLSVLGVAILAVGTVVVLSLTGHDKDNSSQPPTSGTSTAPASDTGEPPSTSATIAAVATATTATADEISAAKAALIDPAALTVCTSWSYAQFSATDADGNVSGFDIDLMGRLATDLSVSLRIVDTDMGLIDSGQALATPAGAGSAGSCDIAAAAIPISPDRQATLAFSDPYYAPSQGLLVTTASTVTGFSSLQSKRLGVEIGSSGEAFANQYAPEYQFTVQQYGSIAELESGVAGGEVDAGLDDAPPLTDDAQRNGGVKIARTFSTGEQYGFAAAKDRAPLIAVTNAMLKRLTDDGTLASLRDAWFPPEGTPR